MSINIDINKIKTEILCGCAWSKVGCDDAPNREELQDIADRNGKRFVKATSLFDSSRNNIWLVSLRSANAT